jgi:oxalate decarboxylase/phosphoglucose isomerase-like protein (cupin superfamily)
MSGVQALIDAAPAIQHRPRSERCYFDVGIGSVCLPGADTAGAYCLVEVSLAPGVSVPRHIHTREDEAYFVLVGELEVILFSGAAILSSPRATFPTSCAIPAIAKITT